MGVSQQAFGLRHRHLVSWNSEIEFVDKGFLNIFDKYPSSCPLGRCCEAAAAGEAASNAPGGNATMAAEAALSAAKAAGASPSQQVLAAAAATAAAAAKASGGDPRKASEDAAAAASQIAKETNLSLAVLSFPSSLLHREWQDQSYVKRHWVIDRLWLSLNSSAAALSVIY